MGQSWSSGSLCILQKVWEHLQSVPSSPTFLLHLWHRLAAVGVGVVVVLGCEQGGGGGVLVMGLEDLNWNNRYLKQEEHIQLVLSEPKKELHDMHSLLPYFLSIFDTMDN